MYEYQATVLRVVDGDTVNVEIDLGIDISTKKGLRLYGINTPEVSTAKGKEVRAIVQEMLTGKKVVIRTFKDKQEKYGRYLAVILLDGMDFNHWLVEKGYAVPYYP